MSARETVAGTLRVPSGDRNRIWLRHTEFACYFGYGSDPLLSFTMSH